MGVLQDFEKRLGGAVEGFFARAFRSGIQPIELARAVQRYAEDTQHVTSAGVVVPNVYRIGLNPRDIEKARTFGDELARELGEVVTGTVAERGWVLRGPVVVKIVERDHVRFGTYELAGRVEVVGEDDAPRAPDPAAPAAAVVADHVVAGSADRPVPPGTDPDGLPEVPRTAPDAGEGRDLFSDRVGSDTILQAILRPEDAPTMARTRFRLRVETGGTAGHEVGLTGGRIVAGRLPGSGLLLDDATVSRQHAAFVLRADVWWVVDLGSTNGTRVNGTAAAEQPLHPGDVVHLGEAEISFVEA